MYFFLNIFGYLKIILFYFEISRISKLIKKEQDNNFTWEKKIEYSLILIQININTFILFKKIYIKDNF